MTSSELLPSAVLAEFADPVAEVDVVVDDQAASGRLSSNQLVLPVPAGWADRSHGLGAPFQVAEGVVRSAAVNLPALVAELIELGPVEPAFDGGDPNSGAPKSIERSSSEWEQFLVQDPHGGNQSDRLGSALPISQTLSDLAGGLRRYWKVDLRWSGGEATGIEVLETEAGSWLVEPGRAGVRLTQASAAVILRRLAAACGPIGPLSTVHFPSGLVPDGADLPDDAEFFDGHGLPDGVVLVDPRSLPTPATTTTSRSFQSESVVSHRPTTRSSESGGRSSLWSRLTDRLGRGRDR